MLPPQINFIATILAYAFHNHGNVMEQKTAEVKTLKMKLIVQVFRVPFPYLFPLYLHLQPFHFSL